MKIQDWVKRANDWFSNHVLVESEDIGWRVYAGTYAPYLKNQYSTSSSTGSSSPCTVPAKVTSTPGGSFVIVSLYENGIDSTATQTNVKLYILDLNIKESITTDQWILATLSGIGVTGGGNVP